MKSFNKIRVLHILPHLRTGGAEMLVKNLILAHDREKFDLAVCSLYPKGGTIIEKELEDKGGKIFYLKKSPGPDICTVYHLYKLMKRFAPHVVHTHLYIDRYCLIPSLVCRIHRKFHTLHSLPEKEVDKIGKMIHWLSFKLFKVRPIALSQIISRSTENLYNIKDVPYIYNGIIVNKYSIDNNSRKEKRKALVISDDDIVLINVANFTSAKNHALLIEAFLIAYSKNINIVLLLAGDGQLKSEIETMVRARNLNGVVKFLGLREDIPELLAASDIFVLSSDWEGVPLSVLEAMAAGKPIVATEVGGLPDIVANNINGLLVKRNDAYALSEAILKIADNYSFAQKLGGMGRLIAQDEFDIKLIAREYEKKYMELQ